MSVVLISRGTMSGAALLVTRLQERTGIRCVAREDLVALVNRHGELAQRIVERLGRGAEAYDDFCDLRRPYLIFMRNALLEYARGGDLVYHGFSGHLLLPPIRHFITMRVHAPLERRLAMTRNRLHCSEDEARRYIERDDEERVRWARFMYGRDVRDPSLYDVCINLQWRTVETACNVVEAVLRDPDCQPTPESTQLVERLRLATQIEAALLLDPRTEAIEASARITGERITIVGPYVDDARRSAVLEIARSIAGGREIEYQYGFAPEFMTEGVGATACQPT
jgi:cytidylate kinase